MNALISFISMLLVAGCAANSELTRSSETGRHIPADGVVEIHGEVRRPGIYPYRSGMKVVDLVGAAGGLMDFASGILVKRGGTTLVDAYNGGGAESTMKSKYMNKLLKAGDVVHILRMQY